MVSRLFAEIREKRGLSYGANSYFSPMRENGTFTASLQTRTDQTEEALSVLQEHLKIFIDNGPTEAELEASKKNITGGYLGKKQINMSHLFRQSLQNRFSLLQKNIYRKIG